MPFAEGKNAGTSIGGNRGSYAGLNAGRDTGKAPGNSSALGQLGRNELIRETQAIVLQFPTKQVAYQQDSTAKAVESQRNGDSAMSLLAAVNMSRTNPRARAMFARLFGFSGQHTDPDFMQAMELMAASYMRQQAEMLGGASDAQAMSNTEEEAGEVGDCLTGDLFAAAGEA